MWEDYIDDDERKEEAVFNDVEHINEKVVIDECSIASDELSDDDSASSHELVENGCSFSDDDINSIGLSTLSHCFMS